MNARDFRDRITTGLMSNEVADDAYSLVDLLAEARAGEGTPSAREYSFALRFLCFVFDPVKNDEFGNKVRRLRSAYRGISDSLELRLGFSNSISETLRTTPSLAEVVDKDFDELVALQGVVAASLA